ncbi:unnamed protein product [Rotaria sp. Silwood1]|nr:unnamed protein product [Rotaria sp. Silwood1]
MERSSKNNVSNDEQDITMDLGAKKVDIGIQTDASNNKEFLSSPPSTDQVFSTNLHIPNVRTSAGPIIANRSTDFSIELPFFRLAKSNKNCAVCDAAFDVKRNRSIEIDSSVRSYALLEHHIYIQNQSRCCSKHISNGSFKMESIETIKKNKSNQCTIYRDELINLFNAMRDELRNNCSKIDELKTNPPLNFDDTEASLPEKAYQVFMGITRDQFDDLCSHIPPSALRISDVRTPRTAIALLLVKLRLGVSHEILCTLFGLQNKRQVTRILESANIALTQHFVSKYLGFHHITREQVLKEHRRPLAQQLLADNDANKAIIILDVPNTMIEKIGDYFRIICAIINRYRPVFVKDTSKDQQIGEKILKLLRETNKIKTYVENIKNNTEKKLKWMPMNATNSMPNFPRMNFDELQELTLGVYQLKQARAYITEHMTSEGAYSVKITDQRQDLLRAQIQSRYKNNTKYDIYIQYDPKNVSGWYCTCPNGSRVVGCCAHIASIMYYLSFARDNLKALQPRSSLYYTTITDAQDYSELSDVDSDSDVSDDDSSTLYILA